MSTRFWIPFLLLATIYTAPAQASKFDIIGAGCVPDSTTVQGGFLTIGTGVQHQVASTLSINFYCPVANAATISSPTSLKIFYTDSSSTTGNWVAVSYYKRHKTTNVLTEIVTAFSDSSPCFQGGTSYRTCEKGFTDTFDPSTYTYYIAVTLARSGTGNTEAFLGASLQ